MTYDAVGNLLTRTDRKGQVSQYTYDVLNRLRRIDYLADGSFESFIYDDFGDLTSEGNSVVTYSYGYDHRHRLRDKTDSRSGRSLHWTYDAVGNVLSKTDYQGEVTNYQYDSTNRLVSLRNSAYLQASYHYDGAGRLLNRILSNGVQTNYEYDADNRFVRLTNLTATGEIIHTQLYDYDGEGNIVEVIQDIDSNGIDEVLTYDYDPEYRLLFVTSMVLLTTKSIPMMQ